MTITDTAPRSHTASSEAHEHSEGPLALSIEEQTAKLPSDTFLWAALGAMGVALAMQISGRSTAACSSASGAAPFLLFGVYNKLVKVAGSDRTE